MRAWMIGAVAATLAGFALACGGAPDGVADAGPCALAAQDSAYLASGPVFPECDVDRRARLTTPNVRLDYRPTAVTRSGRQCEAAVVRFVVDRAGVPEVATARVLSATDAALGDAVLASLPHWRYRPAEKDGVPVRQVVQERRTLSIAISPQGQTPPRGPRC